MAGISGLTNNYYYGTSADSVSTLFSSLKTDKSSSLAGVLSDYASLKNGSYGKLLKTYYGQNTASSTTSSKESAAVDTKTKTGTVDSTAKNALSSLKSKASTLDSATDKLTATGSESLFTKKDIKDDNGTVTNDYDRDAIYSAVSSFAKSYNDTIDAAADSSNSTAKTIASNMSSMTDTMKNALSKVGVSIGTDGVMSVDEDKLKASDVKNVKALFNGQTSYAAQIGKYASQMTAASANALTSLTGSTYSGAGSYASSMLSGTSFSSYF